MSNSPQILKEIAAAYERNQRPRSQSFEDLPRREREMYSAFTTAALRDFFTNEQIWGEVDGLSEEMTQRILHDGSILSTAMQSPVYLGFRHARTTASPEILERTVYFYGSRGVLFSYLRGYRYGLKAHRRYREARIASSNMANVLPEEYVRVIDCAKQVG